MSRPHCLSTRNARLHQATDAVDQIAAQAVRTTDQPLRRVLLKAGCDLLDRSLTIDANAESGILYTGRQAQRKAAAAGSLVPG
jgi:hypothetical protein